MHPKDASLLYYTQKVGGLSIIVVTKLIIGGVYYGFSSSLVWLMSSVTVPKLMIHAIYYTITANPTGSCPNNRAVTSCP